MTIDMEYRLKSILEHKSETITESGCKIWMGSVWGGYGVFKVKGKTLKAHRVAYELYVGDIPKGLEVCHTCDNPLCINYNHLFIGTHTDNMKDRERKGRGANRAGIMNGRAKLTDDTVRYIRNSNKSTTELAKEFGISQSVMSKAKSGKTWRHI